MASMEKATQKQIKIQKLQNTPANKEPYPTLLNLIYEHSELYDKYHPKYYNNKHTSMIWNEIAQQINCTEVACKNRWWLASANFLKYHKTITKSSGNKHALHDLMERFLPYLSRNSEHNLKVLEKRNKVAK